MTTFILSFGLSSGIVGTYYKANSKHGIESLTARILESLAIVHI